MMKFEVKIQPSAPPGYMVHIGSGYLGKLWAILEEEFAGEEKFVVTDSNLVGAGHLKKLLGRKRVSTYIIKPAGEESKTIETVTDIIETMEKAFLGRDTVIIALGGGTVGDIAGFAAAIFKRGVKVVHIPTTTVAQADSSIGGKTGVDSSISKNAYGAFWQPAAVYIDTATLKTLDDRQYCSGMVESVKHALIADRDYFNFFEQNIDSILDRNEAVLERIAYHNCRIKADVVTEDPTEKNRRRVLNYGHTIGHAVEYASNYKLLHGESVAVGIVAAGLIEKKLGLADDARLERIKNVLRKLSMPLSIPKKINRAKLSDALKRDKKSVSGRPKFVLLEDIGRVLCRKGQWAQEVSKDMVLATIEEMYE